ncbi:hydroxypyruvate isomerase family protein [Leifsonia sp. NPDC058292]|uniref:hydroxypyruvate isomerase family protein n=1 Tax=Leifsonia sp. NPDC058292 TaxID=3346428 RepID=UPI0036D8A3B3
MSAMSVNLEWLFSEAGDGTAERIRAAAHHGIDAVEMWGWREKDVDAIETALRETGVELVSLTVDPQLALTDPATHPDYLSAVTESLAVARRLGSPNLVVVAGQERADLPRPEQRAALVSVLSAAAALLDGSGVRLLLEPLNTRVDHVGTFLSSTREGFDIVREVGSPNLLLLLDAYHALMMDEDLTDVIGDDSALIGHVQVADIPGRHQPGTGTVDWAHQFRTLRDLGYPGRFGLEYTPTVETRESLAPVERIVAEL